MWRNLFILYFVFVKKTKENRTQKEAVQNYRIGKLLCEQILRADWSRIETVRAEIGQILHPHTHTHTHRHTHAAKLVVEIPLASISLIVSKATLRPTRASNKTPALAQKWAVWSKPTLDLMHVTLTGRKQRVYSKLVFKTYKKALCNWLRKLSKRNVEFHRKAQCGNTQ